MKLLRELLFELDCQRIIGNTNIAIDNIYFNSLKVTPESLFFAIKGVHHDGHDYISETISNGAIAIICEKLPINIINDITYVQVDNSSVALAMVASNFFNNPSNKIKLIGVTGTNGKTSTVYYLCSLFKQLTFKVGLISTIENRINNVIYPSTHTTPNPIEINELLSKMVEVGCEYCFMEVSSHGILQNRIFGLKFDVGVFTNISRDHLDYHDSFNGYIATKKRFFDVLDANTVSIINADDKYGASIVLDTESRKVFFSIKNPSHYKGLILEQNLSGLNIQINHTPLYTNLVGEFNAYNLLAAYAVALELNQDKLEVSKCLSCLDIVPGRFNIIQSKSNIIGIVDYAHTPDALKQVIKSISQFCVVEKDLIIVIGCGGNRDVGKRSIMGKNSSSK